VCGLAAAQGAILVAPALNAQTSEPLVLAQTIVLSGVRGRIDHLDVDVPGARLFVAALGNDSVEVIDLRLGKSIGRLEHLNSPQGILYVPLTGRLLVANGRSGRVEMFAGNPFIREATVDGLDDADNVRDDSARGAVYIGYGSGLAEIDATTGTVALRIKLAGHPESFQLERQGPRIFVNVPSARQIAVVDRDEQMQIGTWHLDDAKANFPMALDEGQHRLFVATRQPPALVVFDTENGKVVAKVPIAGDADDLFYDAERRQLYAICGAGVVDIVKQRDPDQYDRVGRLMTVPGARTGLFVAERSALYVAVPARGASPAEIRAYSVQ
jgi:DNA-binding beta-propeller fold protein YncE